MFDAGRNIALSLIDRARWPQRETGFGQVGRIDNGLWNVIERCGDVNCRITGNPSMIW